MLERSSGDVGQLSQSLGEEAQGDALSGAGIAGEQGEAAVGNAELDAPKIAVDSGRSEESIGGDIGSEGMEFQAVEREQLAHDDSSSETSSLFDWDSAMGMNAGGRPVAAQSATSERRCGAMPVAGAAGAVSG